MTRYRTPVIPIVILCALAGISSAPGQEDRPLRKTLLDTDKNYTSVGSIGLTVTNYGAIGSRNAYWPSQPSCEYPRGSRIEHLYQGGLWVGGVSRRSGQIHVSTGSSDRVSTTSGRGFEFTSSPGTDIVQRSSLSDSKYFNEQAISHQDFVAWYDDLVPRDSTEPDRSVPLGLRVRQESYAWNFPFADFFVIISYTIVNATADTLDSVYVGLWANGLVRNTNNVRPGTTGYFTHGANGYMDTLRMMYTFDFDGIPSPPAADSYLGIKLLGGSPFPRGIDSLAELRLQTNYNAWRFSSSSGDVEYFSPQDDAAYLNGARSRYDRLSAPLPEAMIAPLRTKADNMTTLLSTGPWSTLAPGDSVNLVFGVICAKKFGTLPASYDTRDQRKNLISFAGLCQQAYDGEDINGNNRIDPGEDLDLDGQLDHYLLPQPPRPPKVRAEVEDQGIALYWDRSNAELSIDPVTHLADFEGYRIYRSNAGEDFTDPENLLLEMSLVGEFDRTGNTAGYNTGFAAIALSSPMRFSGDTVDYWYRFPPWGEKIPHLNGWQYLYGVSAFDAGDSAAGIASLESKMERRRLLPGAPPAPLGTRKIGVYPNPYYARAVWDGEGERERKIYFTGLPQRCEITVYTLAGDVIDRFDHDAASATGTEIEWFQKYGSAQIPLQTSGGEHAWDLISRFDQAIATGLYLFSVKDAETGETAIGKFLIIK